MNLECRTETKKEAQRDLIRSQNNVCNFEDIIQELSEVLYNRSEMNMLFFWGKRFLRLLETKVSLKNIVSEILSDYIIIYRITTAYV